MLSIVFEDLSQTYEDNNVKRDVFDFNRITDFHKKHIFCESLHFSTHLVTYNRFIRD